MGRRFAAAFNCAQAGENFEERHVTFLSLDEMQAPSPEATLTTSCGDMTVPHPTQVVPIINVPPAPFALNRSIVASLMVRCSLAGPSPTRLAVKQPGRLRAGF
jgi:hypothetical protein